MPTPTYTPLATVTLASATSTISFSSIPATYRDLIFVINIAATATVLNQVFIRFNGDSGSNYSYLEAFGDGSASGAGINGSTTFNMIGYHGGGGSVITIAQVMDYSATDKHKSSLVRNDKSDQGTTMIGCRWANTDAVTSALIGKVAAGNFPVGTTINLYGVIA
jgi:hypothetical protein